MALSPTIPTSFVPKQPVRSVTPRPKVSTTNLFSVVSFFVLGASILGSLGVFGYQEYLKTVIKSKEAQLQTAEASINFDTVQDFIRFRDRFSAGEQLLDTHIALSQFLSVLESSTLANVRFSTMSFDLAEDGTPSVEMTGVARSFNALAAQSNAFSTNTNIKSAIFSGITVNANNSVSFRLSAKLAPSLITMKNPVDVVAPAAPEASVSTSTPATTTVPVAPTAPAGTTSPVGL